MSDPAAGVPGGGGHGGNSGNSNGGTTASAMAFCHQCGIEIRPLMAPDPTCPRCNGQFVEVIEESSADPRGLHAFFGEADDRDSDEAEAFYLAHTAGAGGPFTAGGIPGAGNAGPRLDLGGMLTNLLRSVAAGQGADADRPSQGNRDPSHGSAPASPNASDASRRPDSTTGDGSRDDRGNYRRQGQSRLGPFNFEWNFAYGDTEHMAGSDRNRTQGAVPPLADYLRTAFGPRSPGAEAAEPRRDADPHFHDDGMGGAGSASDGRHFNHDNGTNAHGEPYRDMREGERERGGERPAGAEEQELNLSPELAGLRNLFVSLFGGDRDGGGAMVDVIARANGFAGGAGGRAPWGDYVFGQQGLDDIITQLMDQTQSSNAPPPASEAEIEELERFKLSDTVRVAKAKNRECPTCTEDFLQNEKPPTQPKEGIDDPPEETIPDDPQPEDLVAMPCGHLYHEECLVPWLKLHGTCPVCRISIVKDREQGAQQASQQPQQQQQGEPSHPTNPTAEPEMEEARPIPPGGFPFSLFGPRRTEEPDVLALHSGGTPNEDEDETIQQRRERLGRAAEQRMREASAPHGRGSFESDSDDLD